MAERRLFDETSGDSFRLTVNPVAGSWSLRRCRDGAETEGEFHGTFDRALKHSGRVVDLSPGMTIQYGVFATCGDYAAGYMLRIRTLDIHADLFLATAVVEWLTGDPDSDQRRLQSQRPNHRYGAHLAHLSHMVG
jgi:hypothetical protein